MGTRGYVTSLFKSTQYYRIVNLMKRKRAEREEYLDEVMTGIREKLKEVAIQPEISGRPKHIYSIYRKMACKINSSMKFTIY